MALKVDPAILGALSLSAQNTSITSHGGSGFASSFKLSSTIIDGDGNEREKLYFVKVGKGEGSRVMFAGEHQSLNAIHTAISSLCPKSYAHGNLKSGGYFLATDFLDLSKHSSTASTTRLPLAQKLVQLHTKPAPTPEGYQKPQFGFPVPTCCGDTEQDNSLRDNWASFYANNRLRHILKKGEQNHGSNSELRKLVEKTVSSVVPRLLRNGHLKSASTGEDVIPVVVHGDLWSGNHGKGSIDGGPVEEVVYDPSCSWSHNEFEFGIMRMFGGFGGSFEKEYFTEKEKIGYGGKDEPVDEWEDRVRLYELYHHLNHFAIFGGGYRGAAVSIMRQLIAKYGDFEDSLVS